MKTTLMILMTGCVVPAWAADDLAARWSFDEGTAREEVSQIEDELSGNFKLMEQGVRGRCLRFDGFTTLVRRDATRAPRLSGAVT